MPRHFLVLLALHPPHPRGAVSPITPSSEHERDKDLLHGKERRTRDDQEEHDTAFHLYSRYLKIR